MAEEQQQEQEVTYLVGLQTGAEFLEQERQKREQTSEEPQASPEI
jgi:hypothetical protein